VERSRAWRWVQVHGPELAGRCRPRLKPANRSWRADQIDSKAKGQERVLYRAVDSTGQTIDLLLTAKRDSATAKRLFRRALTNTANRMPRVIHADDNRACPVAAEGRKQNGTLRRRCTLRQRRYLNNIVEQDLESTVI